LQRFNQNNWSIGLDMVCSSLTDAQPANVNSSRAMASPRHFGLLRFFDGVNREGCGVEPDCAPETGCPHVDGDCTGLAGGASAWAAGRGSAFGVV
jgi:hypothetical protein